MSSTKCEFTFDKANGVYLPGQKVTVTVELTTIKVKTVKGISFKITGDARSNWEESESDGDKSTKTVHYHGDENFLSETVFLMGSADGPVINLEPGFYTKSMSILLPQVLPESVSGTNGNIVYKAELTLIRHKWILPNKKFQKEFKVINTLNLNECGPSVKEQSEASVTKEFCCCCCASRPLTIDLFVERSGYASGEVIVVRADVLNDSRQYIHSLKFAFERIVICTSTYPNTKTRRDEFPLVQCDTSDILKKSHRTFERRIIVPADIGITQNMSKIVQVEFGIKVTANVVGLHLSPSVFIPLTIATA